ncbi:MAG: glycosyltransferase family 4 protein, partial [Gammaproteobacteria bacterium]
DVVGPPGAAPYLPAAVRVCSCRSAAAAAFLLEAAWHAPRCALRRRPALVLATSGLTAPLARTAALLARAPYLVCVHGLDLVTRHPLYRGLFLPAIRRADCVVANSHNSARLAGAVGVAPGRLRVVHPGVDTDVPAVDAAGFRRRHGLDGARVLLAVGRYAARKGLPEFIERALPALVAADPRYVLVVIGDTARQSVRREGGVHDRIEAAIERTGLASHVRLLGALPDAELAAAYSGADVHVFPVIPVAGDVEGFGMVAVEAAAHGLWTVAFDEGGVADAVIEGESGALVPSGDYAALVATIRAAIDSALPRRAAGCRRVAAGFAWPRYTAEMLATVAATMRPPAAASDEGNEHAR